MAEIPSSKVIKLVEIGPDASITMLNPWMLPPPQPMPKDIEGEALDAELDRRARKMLATVILAWNGVLDVETMQPLALPKDDPAAYDKVPQVVHLKVRQAMMATQVDAEWDPTWRAPALASAPLALVNEPAENLKEPSMDQEQPEPIPA